MKLWEAIKELTEDPTKKFEAKMSAKDWTVCMSVDTNLLRYFKFEVFNGKRLIDESHVGGAFNGNVAVGLDWQPVRQPVTWQEAIHAWQRGKNVYCMSGECKFEHLAKQSLPDSITIGWEEIQWGTWYVED